MAHRAVVAAASPALSAAIQREQQRQPGAPLLWIELGSHVQAGDLRLLVQYAYSGVLSVPQTDLDTAQPATEPTASGRTAKQLALLAQALQMKQAAALLQVRQLAITYNHTSDLCMLKSDTLPKRLVSSMIKQDVTGCAADAGHASGAHFNS